MNILITLLLIVEVVVCILAVLVILAQKSKDQGLGMAFGGGMGESLFGSRAGNVLTRLTVILAAIFMVDTVALGMLYAKKGGGGSAGSIMDDLPVAAAPAAPVAPEALPAAAPAESDIVSEPVVYQVGDDGQLVEMPAAETSEILDGSFGAAEDAAPEVEAVADAAAEVEAVAEDAAAEAAPEAPAEVPAEPAAE